MNVLPSGNFYFAMKKEELKMDMERVEWHPSEVLSSVLYERSATWNRS